MLKKITFFLVCSLSALSFFLFAVWYLTDGFTIDKIKNDFPFNSKWIVALPRQGEEILSQNFYYIGRGSQCYVFESEDKQYVLKFFRLSRYRLPKIYKYTAYPAFVAKFYNEKKLAKEKKLHALFQSCQLAYEEMPEETGILYLHLNSTTHIKKKVMLYDKIKRRHPINIDEYSFILQKHGEQTFPYLKRLLEKKRKEEAKQALANLTELIVKRLHKGIADHDAVIHKNSGFQGNRAFFIDTGDFSKETIRDPQQELRNATRELHAWLLTEDPELANYLDSLLLGYGQICRD